MKKLGFGFMRLPLRDANVQKDVDMDQVCQMVDTFLQRGFTYCDTAYMYHDYESERVVREALVKRHARDSFTLATKMPMRLLNAAEEQPRIFDEQLEKCGVDHFDYYLLHALSVDNYQKACAMGTFGFLAEKKAQGKLRQLGFSFHDTAAVLDEILTAHPEVDFVQLQLNYLDWDSESIQSRKCYETAQKHGKPVVVMEPVKGGKLAQVPPEVEALLRAAHPDWSPASWAVRFAASLEGVMAVLSGMSNMQQMLDNTATMERFQPLTPADQAVLRQAAALLSRGQAVPCTACRYCVEGCPRQIPIPEYFALYNAEKKMAQPSPGDRLSNQQMYYANYVNGRGKASDCIACGQCERACPQHIEIIRRLKEVAQTFET